MRRLFRLITYLVILSLVVVLYPGVVFGGQTSPPLKIGVLLPLQGPMDIEPEHVLDWANEALNASDGINGRQVELVYKDTFEKDLKEVADEFLDDSDIEVVIGPLTSDEAFEIAPRFIGKKKLLISPTATSADLFRAFGGEKFFWRTVQGDMAQSQVILNLLSDRGASRFSLVCQDNAYGKTFLDWMPFFAGEMDLEIVNVVSIPEDTTDFTGIVDRSQEGDPDYIIAASLVEDAVSLKREIDRQNITIPLFLTDGGQLPSLISELGTAAEGMEGTAPTFDTESGFREAYISEFGKEPLSFYAGLWDTFLLAVSTLARHEYKGEREWIEDSLFSVISGRGTAVAWNEIGKAADLLTSGGHPDIQGAAGSLEFDADYGVEPLRSYYANWKVSGGAFLTDNVVSSTEAEGGFLEEGASIIRMKASTEFRSFSLLPVEGDYQAGERSGLQAVIIATMADWANYRHQSDALAIYQLLRKNGLSDDRIIFFMVDDIPLDEANPNPGVVRHRPGGPDNRAGAIIDYTGNQVTAENLISVLTGNKTAQTPTVLESTAGTDVLLYIAGHGQQSEIAFSNGAYLSSEDLASTLDTMQADGKFRRMLVMTELCFGAGMAAELDTPGVLYMTASAAMEQSFATNYDNQTGIWLADDFTWQTVTALGRNSDIYLTDLYFEVYGKVSGSHVQMLNYENFGNIRSARASDFFLP